MSSSSSGPGQDGSPDPTDGHRHLAPDDAPDAYRTLTTGPVDGVRLLRAPAVPTAVVRVTDVPMSRLEEVFDSVFGGAFPAAFERGLRPAGPAFALYTAAIDGPDSVVDMEIGFPLDGPLFELIDDEPVEVGGMRVVASVLPAGDVAVTSYVGGYDGMGEAWGEFVGGIAAAGRAPGTPFWEVYVTEPTPETDPATLRTDLYCVVKTPDDAA